MHHARGKIDSHDFATNVPLYYIPIYNKRYGQLTLFPKNDMEKN